VVWPKKDAIAAAKLNGHDLAAAPSSASAEDKRRQAAHRRRLAVVRDLTPKLVEKAEALDAAAAWRYVIELELIHNQAGAAVAKRRGFELGRTSYRTVDGKTKAALDKLTAAQLQGLALELLATNNASATWSTTGFGDAWRTIAGALRIDYKGAEKRKAAEDRKAAKKPAAKKAKPAKKPAAKASRKGAKK